MDNQLVCSTSSTNGLYHYGLFRPLLFAVYGVGSLTNSPTSLVPRPFLPPVFIASSMKYAGFHTGSDEILAVGTAWE